MKFFRAIYSAEASIKTKDHFYGIILARQQETIRLLKQLTEENTRQNRVYADTKEINFANEYIKENLRIPVLKGAKNPQAMNIINTNIQDDIMEFKRQMEEASKQEAEESKQAGKQYIPYSISNVYDITFNKNGIVSVTILYYESIGGKNYYIKTSYNYDLNNGKSLSIGDLFKPGVDYKTLINNEIRRILTQNKEQYFPGTQENFKGIAEDQPFYLDDNSLVIFFGFNEIAPRESQIPVIKIPLSQFRTALKPQIL